MDNRIARIVVITMIVSTVSLNILANDSMETDATKENAAARKEEAKKHFETGIKLLERQDFNGAAVELAQSVALYPSTSNLYNLANVYVALHRYGDALKQFERLKTEFLENLVNEMKTDVAAQIEELSTLVTKLKVQVAVDGADISIDGEKVATTPLSVPLLLGPGEHTIKVSFPNGGEEVQEVVLVAGTEKKIDFALPKASLSVTANEDAAAILVNGEKMGTTPLNAPLRLDAGTYTVTATKSGRRVEEKTITLNPSEMKTLAFELVSQNLAASDESNESKGNIWTPLFWAGAGGTALFGVTSAILWGVGAAKFGDYKDKADEINANIENETWDYTDHEDEAADEEARKQATDLKDQSGALNKAAVGTTIATGAFAALTVASFFMKRNDEKSTADKLAVSIIPGGIEMRF